MWTKSEITSAITGIKSSVKNARLRIQEVSIELAIHAQIHGDVTLVDKLFSVMVGADRITWTKWVHANMPVTLSAQTGKFAVNKSRRKELSIYSEDELRAIFTDAGVWWEHAPTPKEIARKLNVAGRIQSLATNVLNPNGAEIIIDSDAIRSALHNLMRALETNGWRETVNQRAGETNGTHPALPAPTTTNLPTVTH